MASLTNLRVFKKNLNVLVGGIRRLNVGDTIPIAYMKDVPAPKVLEDKEYPEWIFDLSNKLPSKAELLKKVDTVGLKKMSDDDLRRLKKLITKEKIKQNNAAAAEGK